MPLSICVAFEDFLEKCVMASFNKQCGGQRAQIWEMWALSHAYPTSTVSMHSRQRNHVKFLLTNSQKKRFHLRLVVV